MSDALLNDGAQYTLRAGAWYAAALDTAPLPRELIEAPLRETLSAPEHKFGTLRLFWNADDLPANVGPAVKNAIGATVWVTGQFTPPGMTGGAAAAETNVILPSQVIALEQLKGEPGAGTGGGELAKVEPEKTGIATSTLVLAVTGVVLVGGAAIAGLWYLSRKKTRSNPRRRRRRR